MIEKFKQLLRQQFGLLQVTTKSGRSPFVPLQGLLLQLLIRKVVQIDIYIVI